MDGVEGRGATRAKSEPVHATTAHAEYHSDDDKPIDEISGRITVLRTLLRELSAAIEGLTDDLARFETTTGASAEAADAAAPVARPPEGSDVRPSPFRRWFGRPAGRRADPVPHVSASHRQAQPTTLAALCLQPFKLYVDGAPVTAWQGQRCLGVLLYMLAHHPLPVSRDALIDAFWVDADPTSARRSLHQAVYRLRETLRGVAHDTQLIAYEGGTYRVSRDVAVWTDVDEFERLVAAGDRAARQGEETDALGWYRTAETLYVDDYLPGHRYEDWCQPRRAALRQAYATIAGHLADHYVDSGDAAMAIALSQRLLARDPTNETAFRLLMRGHLVAGQRHLAAAAFHTCTAVLRRELRLEPSAATRRLFAEISVR